MSTVFWQLLLLLEEEKDQKDKNADSKLGKF